MPVLEIEDLKTYYFTRGGIVKAVDGVDLKLNRGEALGLVGESACGKSTVLLSILRLVPSPGRIVGGRILLHGVDLLKMSGAEMRDLRGRCIGTIFQDPLSSFNPVLKVGEHVCEPFLFHEPVSHQDSWARGVEMLCKVGIAAADRRAHDYPHTFSGGMRQRAMIATALDCEPDVILADEPTTALDVSIQAQILALINDLRAELKSCIIFVTHNMGIVAQLCDTIAIMYAGKIVEYGPVNDLFDKPRHPYCQGLINSIPDLYRRHRLQSVAGSPPSLIDLPPGCSFATRCSRKKSICEERKPGLFQNKTGYQVRCWLYAEGELW